MINLTLTWGCECYQKMEGKDRVTFGFIKFFFNLFELGKLLLFLKKNILCYWQCTLNS